MLTLRDYQEKGVDEIRAAFAEGCPSVLYEAPTGSGKTVLFTYIAANAARLNTRVALCVHREELIDQTCNALNKWGVPHGVVAPGYPRQPELPIQVASIYSLSRRSGYSFDLIVFDECHHATAMNWRTVMERHPDAVVLGVTATPCRTDGAGLGNVFEKMILGPSPKTLIREGFLVKPVIWAPATVDLSGLRSRGKGDYGRDIIERFMDRRTITGDCVRHYKRICDGKPFVAYCVSVEHARHVAEAFQAEGYPVRMVDGKMERNERRDTIRALGRTVLGLTSCDLISEGLDVPGIEVAILLRPTKSLGLYLQQVGRALRPAPGKDHALILDCVGNVLKHGMPDMERTWTLDRGVVATREKADDDAPDIRRCEQCYAVHEYAPECPYCGYVYPVKEREIKTEAGELKKLSPEEIQALEEHARQTGRLQDWHAVGKAKGYKAGWAFHRFKQARASAGLRRAVV